MRSNRERRGFSAAPSLRRDVLEHTTTLTSAEQERRAKERARQAALKIAAERAETGHDNADKLRGYRAAAELEPRQRGDPGMSAGCDPRKIPSSSLPRGGTGTTAGSSGGHVAESCDGRKRATAWQALQSDEGVSRHEETLAFMARKRRQASLQKREEEEKKRRSAEKLRLALEKLDQDCKRGVARRPLPSHSREATLTLSNEKDATIEVGSNTGDGIPPKQRWRLVKVHPAARGPDMPPASVNSSGATRDGRPCGRSTERVSAPRSQPKSRETEGSARKHARSGGSKAVGSHLLSCESFQRLQILHRETKIDGDGGSIGRAWESSDRWDNGGTVIHGSQASLPQDEGNADGAPEVHEVVWSVQSPKVIEKTPAREEKDAAWEEGTSERASGSEGGRGSGGGAGLLGRNASLEDNLPTILGSLERTARTIVDLERRCARLSEVIDGHRAAPCSRQMPLRQEERVPPSPPPTPGVDSEELRRPPTPRSTAQPDRVPDEVPSRPAIPVPIPVTLPPREPAPLLEPSTPPPLDVEAFPCSPEVSVRLSPAGQATLYFDLNNAAALVRVPSEESKSDMAQPRRSIADPCFAEGLDATVTRRTVTTTTAADVSWPVAPKYREGSGLPANAMSRPNDAVTDVGMHEMPMDFLETSSRGGAWRRTSTRGRGRLSSSTSEKEAWSACSAKGETEHVGISEANSWLISVFASDIVKARREEAQRRRQEKKAAAARERNRRHEASVAVEEAMLTAAKVVAKEEFEAARNKRTISVDKDRSEGGSSPRHDPPRSATGLSVPIDSRREPGETAAAPSGQDEGATFAEQDQGESLESEPTLSPGCRQRELRGSPAVVFTRDSSPEGKVVDARELSSADASVDTSADRGPGGDGSRPRLASSETDHVDEKREGVPAEAQQRGDEDSKRAFVKRKLAPAELQMQLMNELRLHDDLQDAELRVDGLLAAHQVAKARQEAGIARMLLCQDRAAKEQEKMQLAQQAAFEAALARNDSIHEARLRQAKSQAHEQSARSAEVAMNAVAATAAASFSSQCRQADAAVAAMAAASAHSKHQQASAPAAPMEVFIKLQEAFEKALARNDAIHEARLREAKSRADEQSARATDAAVAAVAAAGAQAQQQRASALATQTALFNELQEAFEKALARNDASHEVRTRRVKNHADEISARTIKAATAALAAAATASFNTQGRQADAAVGAIAAAGVHAQHQQSAALAAQAAMFVELQRRERPGFGARGRVRYNGDKGAGVDGEAARHLYLSQHKEDGGEEWRMNDSRANRPRCRVKNDCDSLVEDIPTAKSRNILRTSPTSGARHEGNDKSVESGPASALTATKAPRMSESPKGDKSLNDREESQSSRESPNSIGCTQHVWSQLRCSQLDGGGGGNGKGGFRVEVDENAETELMDPLERKERGLPKEEEKLIPVKDHETAATCPHANKFPANDGESLSQDSVEATAFVAPLDQNVRPYRSEEQLWTNVESPHRDGRPEESPPTLIEAEGKDGQDAERGDSRSVPQVQTAEDHSRSESGSDREGMCQDAKTPLQSQLALDAADRKDAGVGRNDQLSVPWALTAERQTGSKDGVVCSESWTSSRSPFTLAAADEKDPQGAEKGKALTDGDQLGIFVDSDGICVRRNGRILSQARSVLAPSRGNEGHIDGGGGQFSVPWTQFGEERLEDKDVDAPPIARVSHSPLTLAAADESEGQDTRRGDSRSVLLLQAAGDQAESSSGSGGEAVCPGVTIFSHSSLALAAADENDLLHAERGGRRSVPSASAAEEQMGSDFESDDTDVRPKAIPLPHSRSVLSAAGGRKDGQDGEEYPGKDLDNNTDGKVSPEPKTSSQSPPVLVAADEKDGQDTRMDDGHVDPREQTGGDQTGSGSERDDGVVQTDGTACPQSFLAFTTANENHRQDAGRGGNNLVPRVQTAGGQTENGSGSDDGVARLGARAYSKYPAMLAAAEESDMQDTGGDCECPVPWMQTTEKHLGGDLEDKDGDAPPKPRISSPLPPTPTTADEKDEQDTKKGDANTNPIEQTSGDQTGSGSRSDEEVVWTDATACLQSPSALTATEIKDLQDAGRDGNCLVLRVNTSKELTGKESGSDDGVVRPGARASSKYRAMLAAEEETEGQHAGGGGKRLALSMQAPGDQNDNDFRDDDWTVHRDDWPSSQQSSLAFAAVEGEGGQEEVRKDYHRSVPSARAGEERMGSDSRIHKECKRGQEEWGTRGDGRYNLKIQVADGILEELVEDTVQEYRRLFRRGKDNIMHKDKDTLT